MDGCIILKHTHMRAHASNLKRKIHTYICLSLPSIGRGLGAVGPPLRADPRGGPAPPHRLLLHHAGRQWAEGGGRLFVFLYVYRKKYVPSIYTYIYTHIITHTNKLNKQVIQPHAHTPTQYTHQ